MNNNRSHYKGNPTIFRSGVDFYWYGGWRSNDKLYNLSEELYICISSVDLSANIQHNQIQKYFYFYTNLYPVQLQQEKDLTLDIFTYNSLSSARGSYK